MIDLNAKDLDIVLRVLREHVPSYPIFAFGSRAHGKAKKFSDLDLMIRADSKLDWLKLVRTREAFEDSDLPIMVDLIDWHACNPTFQAIIEPQLVALPLA
jgi:uncharacterized protein